MERDEEVLKITKIMDKMSFIDKLETMKELTKLYDLY